METTYKTNSNCCFKTGRFLMVARKLLIEQRKTILVLTASYLCACILFGLWFGYLGSVVGGDKLFFYIMISGFSCALIASKMFFDMTTKQGRTALIMTPAKASDKFLTRWVGVLPGMLLLVLIGYFVYCYSDLLALGLINGTWMPLSTPFDGISTNMGTIQFACFIFSLFLFNESVYMFGAAAWPKRSFLKSLGVLAIIQILLFFVLTGIFKLMFECNIRIEVVDGDALIWICIGCVTVVSALIMWCSYLKFKRSTVI